jgi:hypothetical protein
MLPRVVDITALIGKQITGKLTSWQTLSDPYIVEHLAGMNPNDDLLVFWWLPKHDWRAVNVSVITGEKIVGVPDSYQLKDLKANAELLATRRLDGLLMLHWWKPTFDWQALNLPDSTVHKILSDPCTWSTQDGDRIIERFAVEGSSHFLIVCMWAYAILWTILKYFLKPLPQATKNKLSGDQQKLHGPDNDIRVMNKQYLCRDLVNIDDTTSRDLRLGTRTKIILIQLRINMQRQYHRSE